HELAHVRRRDFAMQFLVYIVSSVYWFNPLVLYLARRMRIERECACDDIVMRMGTDPEDYASHLIDIARGAVVGAAAALPMARSSDFESRIRAVLDNRTNRISASALRQTLFCGLSVPFILLTATAHFISFPSTTTLLFAQPSPHALS